jgi:hypothetical protein
MIAARTVGILVALLIAVVVLGVALLWKGELPHEAAREPVTAARNEAHAPSEPQVPGISVAEVSVSATTEDTTRRQLSARPTPSPPQRRSVLVHGVVQRREDDKPIAGAVVEASEDGISGSRDRSEARQPAVVRAVSDERGAFQLELPTSLSTRFDVIATARGREPQRSGISVTKSRGPEPTQLTLRLVRAGQVAGKVVSSTGAPMRAEVRARYPFNNGYDRESMKGPTATTDERGEFTLDGVKLDVVGVQIEASAEGFADARSEVFTLPQSVPEPTARVEIVLEPGARIEGTVKFEDGRPVAGASVYADSLPGSAQRHLRSTTASADGAFVLDQLVAGRYAVFAWSPGNAAERPATTLDLAPGAQQSGLALVIPSCLTITGTVSLELPSGEESESETNADPARLSRLSLVIEDAYPLESSVGVNEDGSFRFDCVTPGSHTIGIYQSSQNEFSLLAPVQVHAGDANVHFVVRPASAVITGQVLSRAGAEVSSCLILIERDGKMIGSTTSVFEGGRFETERLPPGHYVLRTRAAGFRQQMLEVELKPGDHPESLTIVLEPKAPLRGIVLGPTGTPLADVDVRFAEREYLAGTDPPWRGITDGYHAATARTDSSGRFQIDVTDVVGRLIFRHDDCALLKLDCDGAAPPGDLEVRMMAGQTVRGRLVSSRTGKGLSARWLSVYLAGESPAINDRRGTSVADGSFAIPHIPAGSWRLAVIGEFNWIATTVELEVKDSDVRLPDIVLRD